MLYEDLGTLDLLEPIKGELESGKWRLELAEDGNACLRLRHYVDPNYPWVHSIPGNDRFCLKWLQIYFKYYKLVPKACYGCWKTMCRPRNLKEVISIAKVQKDLGIHSKLGMEQRPYASGIWGAFWYAPILGGLEGGREVHTKVSEALEKFDGLKVLLKRGCTEMEYGAGPSDRWQYLPDHEVLETLLDKFIQGEPLRVSQNPPALQVHTMRRWIDWAYRNGDPTVFEYAERRSFLPDYVKYNGSKHEVRDYPILIKEAPKGLTPKEYLEGRSE